MKRRLRKKLVQGEFSNHGFEYRYQLLPGFNRGRQILRFSNEEWEFVRGLGLNVLSRFTGESVKGFICVSPIYGRGSVTEGQRRTFERWLKTRTEIVSFTVGPLQDVYAYLSVAEDLPLHSPVSVASALEE